MKNKSGSILSADTITLPNDIGEWFTVFRLHSINHLFQTTHWYYSIMVWVFVHHDYTFIPYVACCTFKITTQREEWKALISKVGALDFILLIISVALSEIDMSQQIKIGYFSVMFIISIIFNPSKEYSETSL